MLWKEEDAQVIREMIFKENEMMNSRITWLVTLQGLLFAALGFAWKDGKELIPAVSLLGLSVAFVSAPTLFLSHLAIKQLISVWDKHDKVSDYNNLPIIGYYDHPSKSPSPSTDHSTFDKLMLKLSSRISIWFTLPILFIVAWIYIFLIWVRHA